ncbi:hypothetical protein QCD71_25335, partial [Sphingomonas sp. PsM26]|nr:hypothetical protein [Sphingomonas sp. PsM26]
AAVARWSLIAASVLACTPFAFGLVRGSRRLAMLAADQALPSAAQGTLDMAVAPRRTLMAAVQLATLLAFGVP